MKYENDFYSVIRKGARLYIYQIQRCENPRSDAYGQYGGRGIKVEYTKSEFLYWFIQKARNFDLSQVCVDRINPDDNYRLDNIQLLTISQNSRKRSVDKPQPKKPLEVVWKNGHRRVFESLIHAAETLQYDVSGLSKIARGIKGPSTKYGFSAKYVTGDNLVPSQQ